MAVFMSVQSVKHGESHAVTLSPLSFIKFLATTFVLIWGGFYAIPFGAPQVIMLAMTIFGVVIATNGAIKGKRDTYNGWNAIFAVALVSAILHWGGFWTNGAVF